MLRLTRASRLAILGATAVACTALIVPAANAATMQVSVRCDSAASMFTCSATVSGGIGPYTYRWNPPVGNTAFIRGNCAGAPQFSVQVTVTDATGASASQSGGGQCSRGVFQ